MKISLKLQDDGETLRRSHQQLPVPVILNAKLPVFIFNFPFFSHFSASTSNPSDLSFSLSTGFSSGPALKLTYAAAAAASMDTPPLTLTLKSGTGLFGSPSDSPLVISARFSFNPSNPSHLNPTFSLLFKPQLGSFSLRKSTFSHPEPLVTGESMNKNVEFESSSFDFEPLEKPEIGKDLSAEKANTVQSIFKGIHLAARTEIPLSKNAALNFMWSVNFEKDKLPCLRINKVGFHKFERVSKNEEIDMSLKKKNEKDNGEVEVLKGVCSWFNRELDDLTRVNLEMKRELEKMKMAYLSHTGFYSHGGNGNGNGNGDGSLKKKPLPSFEKQQRSKKNGNENGRKAAEKGNGNVALDIQNELQRAVKAAASSSSSPP